MMVFNIAQHRLTGAVDAFDVLIEEGAISPQDVKLFHYVDEPQAAWDIIARFYNL